MAWPYNNMYMQQPAYQPAQSPYNPMPQPPVMQVVRVNGRGGAEAYSIGPNSSALLLDESGRIVWAVTTDGAGYKTISPYDIVPHQDAPAPDYSGLESRITRLEGLMDGFTANTPAARKRGSGSSGESDGGAN